MGTLGLTVGFGFGVGVVVEVVVVVAGAEGLVGFDVDAVVVVGEAALVEAKFIPTPTPGNPNVLYRSGAEA